MILLACVINHTNFPNPEPGLSIRRARNAFVKRSIDSYSNHSCRMLQLLPLAVSERSKTATYPENTSLMNSLTKTTSTTEFNERKK